MDQYWGGADVRAPIFVFTGAEGGNVENLYRFGDYGHVVEMASRYALPRRIRCALHSSAPCMDIEPACRDFPFSAG